jgi:hypothetical protein
VIFNRVHEECPLPRRPRAGARAGTTTPEGGGEDLVYVTGLVERALGPGTLGQPAQGAAAALADNFVRYQTLARGEWLRMEGFVRALPRRVPVVRVPNFPHDVHSIAGLVETHPYLFAA